MVEMSKMRILLVEDDKDLLEILSDSFTIEGAKVFEASNGLAALDILSSNQIDLVISDVQMPVMSGVEMLEAIRRANPKVPVVLLATGQANITKEEAVKKGAIGLIAKPFEFETLVKIIENEYPA